MRPIKIPAIEVPNISAPSVDAIVRSATERQRASDTSPTVPTPPEVQRPDVERPVIPAKIIGRVPEPRFPEALRSRKREGEVVVRFIVNEFGTVVEAVRPVLVERLRSTSCTRVLASRTHDIEDVLADARIIQLSNRACARPHLFPNDP